jgi:hypothetical protein
MVEETARNREAVARQQAKALHPGWVALIHHCREMGFGEIGRLKIQDGVPILMEFSIKRIKLT